MLSVVSRASTLLHDNVKEHWPGSSVVIVVVEVRMNEIINKVGHDVSANTHHSYHLKLRRGLLYCNSEKRFLRNLIIDIILTTIVSRFCVVLGAIATVISRGFLCAFFYYSCGLQDIKNGTSPSPKNVEFSSRQIRFTY